MSNAILSGLPDDPEQPLTPGERAVLDGLARGKRLDEVARDLGITPTTARWHLRNAMRKLGTVSIAETVRRFRTDDGGETE